MEEEYYGTRLISDETIAEIKGWTTSKVCKERDEEILQALNNRHNYYYYHLSNILERLSLEDEDEYDVRNGKIIIPDEIVKLLKERDELERAYHLAKIKLSAYEDGVILSDEDAKKILQRGGLRIINYREKIYYDIESVEVDNLLREKPNTTTIKKFKTHLYKNKNKWKAVLLPYVTPMTQAQPVAATASRTPKKPPRRAVRSSAKSGDSNSSDPDPEPERPRQLYTFKSFAQLVDCSEKTLRNKVSAGLFPQPQKTAFGPRFTQQHLDYAVTPAKPPKTRGRPRIADSIQGGVQ
ncbi:hypothetical protein [Acidithiobacillus thiooxidans]|uniref:DNA-binding protein n=1 Tax=Acidithiobacillus thiooxidans ATCC 19377 TaxID=637390 RepID=A0A543Q3J1_ACITH|nr:hypothetical protein [Acidithiobacillus thiooxidans]MDX5934976.1 hypothetical protein [Acidithiobacillus thiooxidans]TQN50899.1 hypothetical protein DLNHIDIE_00760 [Acidithiobacillus thiooxidans ATCC 19377]